MSPAAPSIRPALLLAGAGFCLLAVGDAVVKTIAGAWPATAVAAQVPRLLPVLTAEAAVRGWRVGRPFAVRYCRVGVLDDVGELLQPMVAVLLIGERPGLADYYLFMQERWAARAFRLELPEACAAHRARMAARPAVARVMETEGLAP